MKAWSTHLRWIAALLVLLSAPWSQAAHERQIFIVNAQASADEDLDGDHDFRSLEAAFDPDNIPHVAHDDTVLLKPGTYEESLTIGVPGVTIRAEGGSTQTNLIGSLSIQAKQVTLQGVHIDAAGHPYGLLISAQHVQVEDVRVSGADEAGIRLEDASFAALEFVQADNNAGAGIVAQDSDSMILTRSQFQANGQAGARLQGLRSARVTESRFTLNEGDGLLLEGVSYSQFSQNDFSANVGHGARLYSSAHNELAHSTFAHNGQFGLSLESASQTGVSRSTFENNGGAAAPSGGVLISANSVENVVQENEVRGHSDLHGAGIHLLGPVSANTLLLNVLTENQVGVRLEQNEAGQPQANTIQGNHIESSFGAGILSNGRNNRYAENTLQHNNGSGFELSHTEGEFIKSNIITDNSTAGVHATQSRQLRLVGNTLGSNAQGMLAYDLSESEFSDNQVHDNFGKGVEVVRGEALKLLGNSFFANQQGGVWLEGVRQTTLSANAFLDNLGAGLHLERTEQAEVHDNRFKNNGGGLAVQGGREVTAQFNQFDHNREFGLRALDAQALDARYDFWGSGQGPTGLAPTSASENDVINGVALEQAFPWLPVPPAALVQRSVKGWFFAQNPQPVLLHAPQAGVSVQLADVQASGGWLTMFQAVERPDNAPPLGAELARFSLSAGGQLQGTIKLIVPYDPQTLAPEIPVADLRLFAWDGMRWQELPGVLDLDGHSVAAELSVSAPQEATVILAWPQQRALSSAAWVVSRPAWIVGESLNARLNDPDKDLNPQRVDRLVGVIEAVAQDGRRWTLDALETAPSSGEFLPQWPSTLPQPGQALTLSYQDPEAQQDTCAVELSLIERQPFVLDPAADDAEDSNYDFRFKTLGAALTREPSLKPGETLHLLAGEYLGDWTLSTPRLIVTAEPGARLHGTLALAADEIIVRGLEVDSGRAPAIRVQGDRIALEDVKVLAAGSTALQVSGQGFSMKNSRVESAELAVEILGEHSTIVSNTIIGTPALVTHRTLAATHNWWGRPGGPGEDAQGVRQEDIFPWLLAPPADLLEAAHVKGAAWHHPSVWQILSDVGQAVLALDLANAWNGIQKLFGQEGSVFPLSPGWSLHVHAAGSGRLIVSDGALALPSWMPSQVQVYGVWLEPGQTSVQLSFDGPQRPRAWLAQGDQWLELATQRSGKAGWLARLARLAPQDPMPLWLAVTAP